MSEEAIEQPRTGAHRAGARADQPGAGPSLQAVLVAGLCIWAFSLGAAPLHDNSFLTHLATGRRILDTGGVPHADPYSATAAGEPWVVQSWLVSTVYAWLEQLVGPFGIRFMVGVLAGVLTVVLWRLTRPAEGLVARGAILVLAITAGGAAWSERPLLPGLVLFGVLVALADDDRWRPQLALGVFLVWVNVHGSFPLGFVYLATHALGVRLDGGDIGRDRQLAQWGIVGMLIGAVNPAGPGVLLFPFEMLQHREQFSNIVEWNSPKFASFTAYLFLLQVLLAVVALVRRPAYARAIPMLVFVAASLLAMRNMSVASVVLVVVIASGFPAAGAIDPKRRGAPVTALAVVVALLSVVAVRRQAVRPDYDFHLYPERPLAVLAADGAAPSRELLTQDFVGNLMELLYDDEAAIFMDDRVDMFPADVVADFRHIALAGPGWEQVVERRGIRRIVWEAGTPLGAVLQASPWWQLEYHDTKWLVACRRSESPDGGPGSCEGPSGP